MQPRWQEGGPRGAEAIGAVRSGPPPRRAGEVAQAAMAAGADRLHGPRFEYDDADGVRRGAARRGGRRRPRQGRAPRRRRRAPARHGAGDRGGGARARARRAAGDGRRGARRAAARAGRHRHGHRDVSRSWTDGGAAGRCDGRGAAGDRCAACWTTSARAAKGSTARARRWPASPAPFSRSPPRSAPSCSSSISAVVGSALFQGLYVVSVLALGSAALDGADRRVAAAAAARRWPWTRSAASRSSR